MKILLLFRKKGDFVHSFVEEIKKNLEKEGHEVEMISRFDDLHLPTLSSSMNSLPEIVKKKFREEKYDIIFTQDWSIAFPLLFPKQIFKKKHFSLFHDIETSSERSRVLQKISGNMLGKYLIVKKPELKKKFKKSYLDEKGLGPLLNFKKI